MSIKNGSGIVHKGLVLNFDASESRSAYGPNLLSKHKYYQNQSVTITTNQDGSVTVRCNQDGSTPGIWPLGGGNAGVPILPSTNYTYKLYVKNESPTSDIRPYINSSGTSNLLWVGASYPSDPITNRDFNWISYDLTSGASDVWFKPGVLWTPGDNNTSFTLKEWRLHDRSRWWDSLGNSAGLSINNGATHVKVSQSSTGKIVPGYFSFDGVDDHLQSYTTDIASKVSYPSTECWVRIKGAPTGNYHSLFQKDGGYSGGMCYGIRVGDNNTPHTHMYFSAVSGDAITLVSNKVLEHNTWYHLATTYDGTNLRLYINGVLSAENTAGGGRVAYQPDSFFKVGLGDSRHANADIAAVRVWDRALSNKEVMQNFTSTKSLYGI